MYLEIFFKLHSRSAITKINIKVLIEHVPNGAFQEIFQFRKFKLNWQPGILKP